VRGGENTRQKQGLAVRFFICRGSYKKYTTKMVFAVRPKEDEQQKVGFAIVVLLLVLMGVEHRY
jgi:hypothetical protein